MHMYSTADKVLVGIGSLKGRIGNIKTRIVNADLRILAPILLAAIIRFSLAPFTEHRWDMYIWRLNQAFVYSYHVNPFWPNPGAPLEFTTGYPPLWILLLLLLYPISALLAPTSLPSSINSLWNPYPWSYGDSMFDSYKRFVPSNLPILTLIDKTPVIIADLLIAMVLYKIVNRFSPKYARYSLYAWLFNPLAIWISSVWGMFDAIPTLFLLLAVYCLVSEKYTWSSLSLVVSILFKLYPLVLVPMLSLAIYKKGAKREALRFFLVTILVVAVVTYAVYFVSTLLFNQEDPLALSTKMFVNLFYKRASPDWMGQNSFRNLTPLIFLNEIFARLNVAQNIPISPILMGAGVIGSLVLVLKGKTLNRTNIISYVVAAHFVIYLTYSTVNEQNIIWVLPFLLVLAAEKGSSTLRLFYWIVTFLDVGYIIWRYDLSYFVSPFYLIDTLGVRIPLETLVLVTLFLIIYGGGIKLALRKSGSETENQ